MRSVAKILVFCCMLLGRPCAVAWADGGAVRLVRRQGDYQISVFTSPNPPRAGPVDISVLLQEADSGQPILDAPVTVSLSQRGGPHDMLQAEATLGGAANKLMRAALVELPASGWWDVEVLYTVGGVPARARFDMEAGQPLPRWLTEWPWFAWPAGVVLVFGIHRWLVALKAKSLKPV